MTRWRISLATGVSALALGILLDAPQAQAVCPGTIVNGETQVAPQNLANGQSCTIDTGGAIQTVNDNEAGIVANDNNAITNSGTIGTMGFTSRGIIVQNGATIINSGTIATMGTGNSEGILANAANNTIINSGIISTVASTAEGIFIFQNNSVTNSGAISTTGSSAAGISAIDDNTVLNTGNIATAGNAASGIDLDDNNSVINNGSIMTLGFGGFGIGLADSGNTIINNGSIATMGDSAVGISVFTFNTIINTGSITTAGTNATGIGANNNNTIINSGLISVSAPGALAVRFANDSNTLTLLPGSVIIGGLNFISPTNTLNIGNGLSIANTLTSNLPAVINANGAPFAVNGLEVAVVDPTNLAAQDELLSDLTGGIFSTVQNRLGSLRNGVAGVTTNPRPMSFGAKSNSDAMAVDHARQGWAQAFGSYRLQREHGPSVDSDIRMGGLVSGFDGMTGSGTRIGVFFGGSRAEVEAEFDSQETDVDSLFGGFYASTLRGSTAIDFALTVGYSDYDRSRRVANNLAAGGIETAKASYDGWFVSPELTFTRPMWVAERRFEKSVTLRYAGLFLDGFTESSTAAPLTVSSRNVHVLQARTQLTVPDERANADGSTRRNAFYIGLEGRAQVGNQDISGALLAQNITFNPGGDDAVAGVFAGLQFERTSAGGTTYYASVEGQHETGGGRQASGKAGIRFRF